MAGDPGRGRRRGRRRRRPWHARGGHHGRRPRWARSPRCSRGRRTIEELKHALDGVTRLLGAEEAAISRLDAAAGCLVTVSDHEWSAEGERWQLDDYPTTAHVVAEQAIGQVIAGDPAGDPAELAVLETAGMRAVLLMPLVFGGATIALLEIYRRAPQAWTNTQVDLARVLANHIAASLARVTSRRVPQPRPAPALALDGGRVVRAADRLGLRPSRAAAGRR